MTSVITHMGIGIIIAELFMRFIDDDLEFRKQKRIFFWLFGLIGGLAPDLDVIPAIITGEHFYTFHHYYTHTFFAVFLIFSLIILFRFNPYLSAFFLGFVLHLTLDFIDNSISPLGPFDMIFLGTHIEWGMLCGWQEMPCIDGVCGWASEFWLYPEYANHDLWTVFLNNGWGFSYQLGNTTEFYTYYDIVLTIISIPLILATLYLVIKKMVKKY
ncbi:MAG: metal-dependent hydrolase [Promethearchaeota archaeon]